MPISKYFGGHGKEVMADMKRKHGAKGERIFYATANARKQKPKRGAILRGKGGLVALLLLSASSAWAQVVIPGTPTSSQETISVSNSAVGITADLCGTNNTQGALIYVVTNGIYTSLHGPTATPDSGDFTMDAGDTLFVRPASKARFIRQSADSNVKIQCVE